MAEEIYVNQSFVHTKGNMRSKKTQPLTEESSEVQRVSRTRRWLVPALISGLLLLIIIISIIGIYVKFHHGLWSVDQQMSIFREERQRLDQRLFTLTCVLQSVLSNDSSVDGCCPDGWTHSGFSCFFYSDVLLTWNQSKTWCEQKDSHLVKLITDRERNFIFRNTSGQFYWIGLSDWRTGQWEWVDQTEYIMDSRHWRPGQPDDWNGEDCAHLHRDGLLNDLSCSQHLKFICQKQSGSP